FRALTGNQDRPILTTLHQGLEILQHQLPLGLLGVVAGQAVPGEDGVDIAVRGRLGGIFGKCCPRGRGEEDQRSNEMASAHYHLGGTWSPVPFKTWGTPMPPSMIKQKLVAAEDAPVQVFHSVAFLSIFSVAENG